MKDITAFRSNIAKLRAIGYSNQEIAFKLGVHPSTISYHVRKMREDAKKMDDDVAFKKFLFGTTGTVSIRSYL